MLIMLLVLAYTFAVLMPLDPIEQRPGTTLSGLLAVNPVSDWSALEEKALVYVQANTWYGIPHSVTVRGIAYEGELFIPCARCADKRWPKLVAADPEVTVKASGALHVGSLERIEDMATLHRVFNTDDHQRLAGVWLYRFTQIP